MSQPTYPRPAPPLPPRPRTMAAATPSLGLGQQSPPAYSPALPARRPMSSIQPREGFFPPQYTAQNVLPPHRPSQSQQSHPSHQMPRFSGAPNFADPSLIGPDPQPHSYPNPLALLGSPATLSPPPGDGTVSRLSGLSPLLARGQEAHPPSTHPLPNEDELYAELSAIDRMADPEKLSFAQDVIRLLDRHFHPPGRELGPGSDSPPFVSRKLAELSETIVPIVISFTTHDDPSIKPSALYLRGQLQAEGYCPTFLQKDPRQAFADFEAAARAGESRGWYRLGRDYETVGDLARAKDCFQRGSAKGSCESSYRLGMAHLLGQLDRQIDPNTALPLLSSAAKSVTVDFALPAYIYGMLLIGELQTPQPIPTHLVHPITAPPELLIPQQAEALKALTTAAYLHHPPAQYKMGFLHEHASLGCPYDPLMSVQWYALGSQGGDMDADMGLSKWFLCGAEGCFPKNEDLARSFAEKAARKGHANGCFAMGYYFELGIGGKKDLERARKWYNRASRLNSQDARDRLKALEGPAPHTLSATEHETRLHDTLIRRRTTAKNRSDRLFAVEQNRASRALPSPAMHDAGPSRHVDRRASAGTGHAAYQLQVSAPAILPRPRSSSYVALSPMGTNSPRNGLLSPNLKASPPRHPRMSPLPQIQSPAMPYPSTPAHSGMNDIPPPRRHDARQPDHGQLRGQFLGPGSPAPVPLTQGMQRISLHDKPVDTAIATRVKSEGELEAERAAKREWERRSGPQTFAEMGLVSKPVEDEGCRVM